MAKITKDVTLNGKTTAVAADVKKDAAPAKAAPAKVAAPAAALAIAADAKKADKKMTP